MPLASMVETESYVRKFTNINCKMRSLHIYSAFDAENTIKDGFVCCAVMSTARYAVHAMKLAVIK